jgi:6-pyruvoyltetrahydropterin/6-carboxytetrahydropterin synthase
MMAEHVTLSRIHRFSSAHRLHSNALSGVENQEVYDKCNNPNGHGHDYYVEISLIGTPDTKTGMIIPLDELDQRIRKVLDIIDYKHLDKEVEFFKSHLSTGEIIIQYLWQELEKQFPAGMLYHLKLWETSNNYFELGGN